MRVPALAAALERAAKQLGVGDGLEVQLERPQNTAHGDLATNLAMLLAPRLGRPPRDLAQALLEELDLSALQIEKAEIAGPGFINFSFSPQLLHEHLRQLAKAQAAYGRQDWGGGHSVIVEFVSANPTGPLHVGHGRGAAIGDTIARLLECTGHSVHREFYVNDAGAQIDKLVESVQARYKQQLGEEASIPDGGYHGEYVVRLANDLQEALGERLGREWSEDDRDEVRRYVVGRLRSEQEEDLRAFRVSFDEFRFESAMYASNQIQETLSELDRKGLLYEKEGASWLRTTASDDDKDRVLVKSDGSYTYFLPDVAYHRDKRERGFEIALDVWGADHHGYIGRMRAAMKALGLGPDFFEVVIVQLVRLERGGAEVKFSKRAGEYVTLRELIDEVGPDVTRYFFLERSSHQQMVFDLDLALERSEKNPVYKIQYAHARIRSVYRRGQIEPETIDLDTDLAPLAEPEVFEIIKTLVEFPEIVEAAARSRAPHRLTDYLEGVASQLNSWYHAGTRDPSLRVLGVDEPLMKARLVLARGTEIVLRNGLALLGIDAPERM